MSSILLVIQIILHVLNGYGYSRNLDPADSDHIIVIPTAGNSWVINDLSLNRTIIRSSGITNWTDTSTRIRTYFKTERAGEIDISIRSRTISGTSAIKCKFGTEEVIKHLSNNEFDTLQVGKFVIKTPGYQWIELQGISKTDDSFAEITDVIIEGEAAEGKVYYVRDDFHFGRRGPSVHLRYDIPDQAGEILWFYNEITVPEGNDVTGSYFMANGFSDGYFGIQVNSETERRILFSVWSPYKTDNPGEIPDDYKIILLDGGNDVVTGEFGNEGSGGQSFRRYFWKAGTTYGFLLKGEPSENNSVDYTAYFFAPERGEWELIASFRRPKTTGYLKNLYSFLENFRTETGSFTRMGYYSNQWIRDRSGKWFELVNARFTFDATARKEARMDYAGGIENGKFFLKNCGFFNESTPANIALTREPAGKPPETYKIIQQ
ncbi:MAG: DUF3472 domain-containing protein [Bacteroidales bacterium]|nr:DUF3472 domain-containing protein [Bacteroidales bacterium]